MVVDVGDVVVLVVVGVVVVVDVGDVVVVVVGVVKVGVGVEPPVNDLRESPKTTSA